MIYHYNNNILYDHYYFVCFIGAGRAEHLQRVLHATHRVLQALLAQRALQQRQEQGLHQPQAANRGPAALQPPRTAAARELSQRYVLEFF